MCRLLKNKASLKIIIFMRLAIQDKLQTRVNLKKKIKKWKGSKNYCLCGCSETTDHIFFNCILAKIMWTCFKEA
jgi:hypothetical protein